MKVSIIDGNIIAFEFTSLKEQGMTFFRMSEFYESPFDEIRNQYFSFEQFLEHYTLEEGLMSYFYDWTAFNIPGYSINNFFKTFPPTKREGVIKTHIENLIDISKDYYLISSIKDDKEDFNHELCHAKYLLNDSYRKNVNSYIESIPKDIYYALCYDLIELGYSNEEKILFDEINAYLATSTKKYLKEIFKIDFNKIDKDYSFLQKKFKQLKKDISINIII